MFSDASIFDLCSDDQKLVVFCKYLAVFASEKSLIDY